MNGEKGEILSNQESLINGLTGESGRDGILSPEQKALLDTIQKEAAEVALKRIEERQEGELFPIVAMATGIGKTKIEHLAIRKWKKKHPDAKILFIAGTKQVLVEQSRKALTTYMETEDVEEVSEETGDIEEALRIEREDMPSYRVGKFGNKEADVQVATIQMIQSAYKRGTLNQNDFDLVIVDEAHNVGTPTRQPIINSFKNVMGFTATPIRSSGKLKHPKQYGFESAYNLPLTEAQEKRLLPPLLGMQIDTSQLVERIPTTPSGQIDYKELENVLKKSPDLRPFIAERVANIIKSGDKEYKAVMVVNFVWEAEELAKLLKEKGVNVGVAVNKPAAKRIHSDEIPAVDSIERYKLPRENTDSLQVLISPYVASEGFDAPFTEVLVWASPTDSDLRYTQYTGRLARRAPGKAFGLVVDCLYQTSQYNWSYNFGMWMKGSVKHMPNGLLYLGPEGDIEGLLELEAVKNMREKADIFDPSDLEGGLIEELKDTDFSLTRKNLDSIFIGAKEKISTIAAEIISELKQSYPEYFVKRRGDGNQIIEVIPSSEGKQAFISAMKERGVELKNLTIEELKDTDFSLADANLHDVFIWYRKKIRPLANEIIIKLKQSHPEYFVKRKSGSSIIDVIVSPEGKQGFISAMKERGVELKNLTIEELKDTDFSLTPVGLQNNFRGNLKIISPIAAEVTEKLKRSHPEYFMKRKSGTRIATVIPSSEGKQAFISAMKERGVELKGVIEKLKEGDFSLIESNLTKVFRGSFSEKMSPVVIKIIADLKQSHPEYFMKREKGIWLIDVIVSPEGKQAFIDAMVRAGIKLKNPEGQ